MNQSFIDVHNQLSNLGIENRDFLLDTRNAKLRKGNIDPWDTNLTKQQQLIILAECANNIWYFFREVIRVPYGNTRTNFKLNLLSTSIIHNANKGYSIIYRSSRQTTSTLTLMMLELYYSYFSNSKIYENGFNIDNKEFVNYVPSYFTDIITTCTIHKLSNSDKNKISATLTGANNLKVFLDNPTCNLKHTTDYLYNLMPKLSSGNQVFIDMDVEFGYYTKQHESIINTLSSIAYNAIPWYTHLLDAHNILIDELHDIFNPNIVYINYTFDQLVSDPNKYMREMVQIFKSFNAKNVINNEIFIRPNRSNINVNNDKLQKIKEIIDSE